MMTIFKFLISTGNFCSENNMSEKINAKLHVMQENQSIQKLILNL
jgi:hypothetical protein